MSVLAYNIKRVFSGHNIMLCPEKIYLCYMPKMKAQTSLDIHTYNNQCLCCLQPMKFPLNTNDPNVLDILCC